MIAALPCPCCGRAVEPRTFHHGYSLTCPNCYDPSEGASSAELLHGFGTTETAAIVDWNEQTEAA